jgi:hypothetical protein
MAIIRFKDHSPNSTGLGRPAESRRHSGCPVARFRGLALVEANVSKKIVVAPGQSIALASVLADAAAEPVHDFPEPLLPMRNFMPGAYSDRAGKLGELFEQIRNGELKVTADNDRTGARETISPTTFFQDDMWIWPTKGQLFQRVGPQSNSQMVRRFTAMELEKVAEKKGRTAKGLAVASALERLGVKPDNLGHKKAARSLRDQDAAVLRFYPYPARDGKEKTDPLVKMIQRILSES